MKKFHWDDCKYSFRGLNTLEAYYLVPLPSKTTYHGD